MNKSYYTTAVLDGTKFKNFGINEITAEMYGFKPNHIINVELSLHENQTIPEKLDNGIDYWGYYENERKDFLFIYDAYFLLDMCFPSGLKYLEEHNKGKAYRLNIKQTN